VAFCWLFVFLNNYISTNIHGHFESFHFFNQEITLVAGLVINFGERILKAGIRRVVNGLPENIDL